MSKSNAHHCLFSLLPSASIGVWHTLHIRCRSLSIGVLSIKVQNVPICKMFPAGPGSNVEWPSLHCVWHRNAGWVQGRSQPMVASLSCVFFSIPFRRCLWVVKAIYKQLCFCNLCVSSWVSIIIIIMIIIMKSFREWIQILFCFWDIVWWIKSSSGRRYDSR